MYTLGAVLAVIGLAGWMEDAVGKGHVAGAGRRPLFRSRDGRDRPDVLALVGFAALTLGGWLGGSIVYVHGMRVLKLVDEPTRSAVTPGGKRKDRAAA